MYVSISIAVVMYFMCAIYPVYYIPYTTSRILHPVYTTYKIIYITYNISHCWHALTSVTDCTLNEHYSFYHNITSWSIVFLWWDQKVILRWLASPPFHCTKPCERPCSQQWGILLLYDIYISYNCIDSWIKINFYFHWTFIFTDYSTKLLRWYEIWPLLNIRSKSLRSNNRII